MLTSGEIQTAVKTPHTMPDSSKTDSTAIVNPMDEASGDARTSKRRKIHHGSPDQEHTLSVEEIDAALKVSAKLLRL